MTFDTVQIHNAQGTTRATFVPAAGMVCCSLSHDGRELLDSRNGVEAYATRGKTMGVPLLYPWANRLAGWEYDAAERRVRLPQGGREIPRDPRGLPIHGVLPELMRWEALDGGAKLRARLIWENVALLRCFPFRHEVLLEAEVGEGWLRLTTTVRAGAGDPVPVCFGYHPYLRLPGDTRTQCEVELPPCERLVLDERSIPTGAREPLGPRRMALGGSGWDDGLALADLPARFIARGEHGTVALELIAGYDFGQLYSPPSAGFICFEPMTAPTGALTSGDGLMVLDPGQEHAATFRIRVTPPVAPGGRPDVSDASDGGA